MGMEMVGAPPFSIGVEEIITSVSLLSHARICIYDLESFFSHDDKNAIQHQFKGHYCDFCYMVRSLPGGKNACIASDVEDAVKLAEEYRTPFFHQCHIGILEYVVPIFYKERLIAIVFIGQCRIENETRYDSIKLKISALGGNTGEFANYFGDLPATSRTALQAAGTLLNAAFKYLIEKKGKNALEQYFAGKSTGYINQAVTFIDTYFADNISAGDVIAHVHLNSSYFARLFKGQKGKSITDYIIEVRLERAKEWLIRTDIPIGNIALNVGFSDQNYFARKFSQSVGCSPREFRKKGGNKSPKDVRGDPPN